jgi:cytidylate kinase
MNCNRWKKMIVALDGPSGAGKNAAIPTAKVGAE